MNKTPQHPAEAPAPQPAFAATEGYLGSVPPPDGHAEPPQRIGDFSILRILGEGGMGTVYLAEDVRLGRKAAIKTMKPELAAKPENRLRFVREARAAAAVEHDNIVPVWQVGESADSSPFIAMPFLQGETLETRLKREPIQPLGIILKVAREVAEGLAAAHARGLVHRDLKPGNLWMESHDEPRPSKSGEAPSLPAGRASLIRVKILDFGLARSPETEDVQITASGTIVGTPTYMAPEQARGETVDHRADLFSLGVLLYRMSTGKLPFGGPNTMAVLAALATVTPQSVRTQNRTLPLAVSDLIDRLLSKDSAGRPQSAAEVAVAVRQIDEELQARKSENTVSMEIVSAGGTHEKAHRGRRALLVTLGLLALVPLVLWLTTLIPHPPPVETPTNPPERLDQPSVIVQKPVSAKEIYTFAGHAGPVTNVAVSADGKIAVSVSLDRSGIVWDLEKGKLRHQLIGSPDALFAVAITPDGKMAMTGGQDRVTNEDHAIRVWDTQTGQQIHALKGHSGIVGRLAVTSDGKSILSSSWDRTLRHWRVGGWGDSEVLLEPGGVPLPLDPRGQSIVVGEPYGIGILRPSEAKQIEWIPALGGRVDSLARVSESVIAVAGQNKQAVLVDLATKKRVWLIGHTKNSEAIDAVAGGKYVVTGSDDETVRVWDVSDGSELNSFNPGCGMIRALRVLPDGQRVLCTGSDGTLRLWRLPLPKNVTH